MHKSPNDKWIEYTDAGPDESGFRHFIFHRLRGHEARAGQQALFFAGGRAYPHAEDHFANPQPFIDDGAVEGTPPWKEKS